jgi:UDP-N-acetylmuramoylalanine-D-glutamate ligase
MMKQFILTATSIAYILSITSIADAKVAKTNRKVTLAQPCQSPAYVNSKYTQLAKTYPGVNNDLKDICQLINTHQIVNNRRADEIEDLRENQQRGSSSSTRIEIKSIKLSRYSQEKINAITALADTDIELIEKKYAWNKKTWNLSEAKTVKHRFTFVKMGDKWIFENDSLVIK